MRTQFAKWSLDLSDVVQDGRSRVVLHFDLCVKDNATLAKSMYTPYDIMVKLEVMFGDQNHDDRRKEKWEQAERQVLPL